MKSLNVGKHYLSQRNTAKEAIIERQCAKLPGGRLAPKRPKVKR